MLGAPMVKIELTDQNLDLAVDQAMKIFEEYAPREFFDYYVFPTVPGKSVYEMPPDVGYIRNVFYRKTAQFAFTAHDLNGAIPVEYFYPGGAYNSLQGGLIDPVQPMWGRMGEWVLYSQYSQMFSNISSSIGGWEFLGGYDKIKLYPVPCTVNYVIVHYIQKCKDWSCTNQFIMEYALALTKIMLGRVRTRIRNPPGPNGGVQLDGDQLLQEGKEEKEKLESEIAMKYGDLLYPSWG
jgi:hypothetical protein